ncbi:MAG: hypothetical protein ABH821_03860 [archaeon]
MFNRLIKQGLLKERKGDMGIYEIDHKKFEKAGELMNPKNTRILPRGKPYTRKAGK